MNENVMVLVIPLVVLVFGCFLINIFSKRQAKKEEKEGAEFEKFCDELGKKQTIEVSPETSNNNEAFDCLRKSSILSSSTEKKKQLNLCGECHCTCYCDADCGGDVSKCTSDKGKECRHCCNCFITPFVNKYKADKEAKEQEVSANE